MKKLFIISILLTMMLTSFGQTFQTRDEWVKYTNHHQAIGIVLNPGRLGLGIIYISKPVINQISIIPMLSSGIFFEDLTSIDKSIRTIEFGIGLSYPINYFSIDIIPIYNTIDEKYSDISKISMDIGLRFMSLRNGYIAIYFNPFVSQIDKFETSDTKFCYCFSF